MNDHDAFIRAIIARPDDDLPRLIYADWLDETAGNTECRRCVGTGGVRVRGEPDDTCEVCHGTGTVSNGHGERAEFIHVQCELARLEPLRPSTGVTVAVGREPMTIQAWRLRVNTLRRRERELGGSTRSNSRWPENVTNKFLWLRQIVDDLHFWHGGDWLFRRGFVEEITCSWSDWQQHAAAIRAATPLRRVRLTTWPPFHPADLPMGIEFELPVAREQLPIGL